MRSRVPLAVSPVAGALQYWLVTPVEERDHSFSTDFVGEVVDLVPFSFGLSLVNHCGIEPNWAWQDGVVDGFISREFEVKEVTNFFVEFPYEEALFQVVRFAE